MINIINKFFFKNQELSNSNSSFQNLKKKKTILKLFNSINNFSKNSEIRYVGGCIRKIICNEKIDDLDFAVNLNPKETIKVLKKNNIKFYETGIEHGTITAIIDNDKFEITSLRKDTKTDGRHAKVTFSMDWYEDAQRRDFTINSIYADINGNLYDPFNGKEDLKKGLVKFIGDTNKRIEEDYLRILRYIRFYINYSKLPHDNKIKKIIKQNLNGISKVSSERLLDEFKKIINSKNFLELFNDNFSIEVIILIFPQFKNIDIFKNLNDFAKSKIKKLDYILIISLLLFDNSDNIDYFLYKYNISKFNKNRILFINNFYKNKISNDVFTKKNLWKIFYYNGKQSLIDLIYFEIFKSKKNNKKLIALLDFFIEKNIPTFPIKAKNLIKDYGMQEGKLLGIKLKKIEEKWVENSFKIFTSEIDKILKS